MKEINPSADAQSVSVDLQMDPGRSVRISTVDPQGQPIAGVKINGAASDGYAQTTSEPTFEVANLSPGEVRTITFHHEARKLGCVMRLKADEAGPQPISVRLQPVGTLKGRLLHPDGAPATGSVVEIWVLPSGDFSKRLPTATTDVQGRFECTLLPGAAYDLVAQGARIDTIAEVARDVSIERGQVKDLGDVTLRRR
jgi:hypothetical protein